MRRAPPAKITATAFLNYAFVAVWLFEAGR
jgi:hypothetical protein